MSQLEERDPAEAQNWAIMRVTDELERYEQQLVREGIIPGPQTLPLRKYGFVVACLHILPIALIAAVAAILVNFILFNKLLHFGT